METATNSLLPGLKNQTEKEEKKKTVGKDTGEYDESTERKS